ncbi:MAG: tRNA (adenosine(37)-N6)-dimethylallyltransferase MiaA [Ignavibacteriaceae bacterium]|nr:tRNA (adenosine(37)-N6)-dimethylallyltransferase MiaA [Ignavibacteriaceae bacterium]
MAYNLITILGSTATGKTKLAAQLAHHYNGEIVSADSRQVYKGMDIGTGKDLSEYIIKGNSLKYYMIDIIDPSEEFNLFQFKKYFSKYFEEIISRSKIPFLVGGTGMYLSSIIQRYSLKIADRSEGKIKKLNSLSDEELIELLKSTKERLHNVTDIKDRERAIKAILIENSKKLYKDDPIINSLNIGVNFPREEIKKRITERLKKRLDEGMIDEVKVLLEKGVSYDKLKFFGLEYKYIAMYLNSEINYNDMFQKLNSAIHNFSKRQMTWFRKMEREGVNIFWIEGNNFESAKKIIDDNYLPD